MLKNLDRVYEEVANQAPLKAEDKENDDNVKAINVYNVPRAWLDKIKKNGYTFSSFAKIAIQDKIKTLNLM